MKLLFICSRNRLRSPTAEAIFSEYQGLEVTSAGTAPDAENRLDHELVQWADIIFVMERSHHNYLSQKGSSGYEVISFSNQRSKLIV